MRMRALVLAIVIGVVVLAVGVEGSTGDLGARGSDGRVWSVATAPDDPFESLLLVPRIAQDGATAPLLVNTPAPPEAGPELVEELTTGIVPAARSPGPRQEASVLTGNKIPDAVRQKTETLREAGVRFDVQSRPAGPASSISPQSTSEEVCYYMLMNPEMDVVELGDGTASLEYWQAVYHKIYYDKDDYNSATYSLVMQDETNGSDTIMDPFWSTGKDYDLLGQAFQAPQNLTYMRVDYSYAYIQADADDVVGSNLWLLDSQGRLTADSHLTWARMDDVFTGWKSWYWELTQAEDAAQLAEASGRTVALAFDMLSDQTAPGEVVWVDDAQVTLCYNRGAASIYLPMVAKQYGTSSGPTCVPREPDSVSQMGKTAVGATCGGSFNALDEKDYYDLNLTTAASAQEAQANIPIRLRLFNLPNGSNWDAMIYQNSTGYPLACQIGTPGDSNKDEDCTLDSNKNYFVLVSRGPETSPGGTYQMSVTRR